MPISVSQHPASGWGGYWTDRVNNGKTLRQGLQNIVNRGSRSTSHQNYHSGSQKWSSHWQFNVSRGALRTLSQSTLPRRQLSIETSTLYVKQQRQWVWSEEQYSLPACGLYSLHWDKKSVEHESLRPLWFSAKQDSWKRMVTTVKKAFGWCYRSILNDWQQLAIPPQLYSDNDRASIVYERRA